jgi:hypothetical protein
MGDETHEFQKAESGASYTYPMQASALKVRHALVLSNIFRSDL